MDRGAIDSIRSAYPTPASPHGDEQRVIEVLIGPATGQSFQENSIQPPVPASNSTLKRHLRSSSPCDWLNRIYACVRLAVLSLLSCLLVYPAAAAEPAVKNVLILHNWATLPQSWALMQSTVRARVPGQINFYNASVENPRFDEEVYRESLAETLHRGYGGVKLDLVVAATFPVLEFVMQYRDRCFRGSRLSLPTSPAPKSRRRRPA